MTEALVVKPLWLARAPPLQPLPESGALPSARSTRQTQKNTRQSLCRMSHSAKRARRTVHRQRLLCRVLFLGHSAQTLPSARRYSAKKSDCHGAEVTETAYLPSVLGDTWQRSYLCRVPPNTLGKCHTRFWKVNRMRTMYVSGSEIHVHGDYINDSSYHNSSNNNKE
jgi:hypothetical protein